MVGELAGDFGRKVAEEVGHGDEAGADDAGGDFGDAVSCAIECVGQLVKRNVSVCVGGRMDGYECLGKG